MNFNIRFILLVLLSVVVKGLGAQQKIEIEYQQEDVYVIVDEQLFGLSPEKIKINFDIDKQICFYKKGYYSQRVEIDPDVVFSKLTVNLIRKNTNTKLSDKRLLKFDTLLVSRIVTNFTTPELEELFKNNFIDNNFILGDDITLFQHADSEIKNSRYQLGIQVVNSDQIRSVYKSPRFCMAQINIRWSLLDKTTNKVVYHKPTEGLYFVSVKKPKGIVVSELMKKVMEEAIEEAQNKLITDNDFIELITLE